MSILRAFSSGGGVQSIAALVLSAQDKLDYPLHLFANVGDDSEYPPTLDYMRKIARPYAAKHGIEFKALRKVFVRGPRKGTTETVYGRIYSTARSTVIPIRLSNGKPGKRSCTVGFKIRVIQRYCRTTRATHVISGLGISTDEAHRARDTEWDQVYVKCAFKREYPLLDLDISRDDCKQIILDAGLPIPPKSSCYFCPFHKKQEWLDLSRDHPDLFTKACDIEQHIKAKREHMGKDGDVWIYRPGLSLSSLPVSSIEVARELETDRCEEGYCFT